MRTCVRKTKTSLLDGLMTRGTGWADLQCIWIIGRGPENVGNIPSTNNSVAPLNFFLQCNKKCNFVVVSLLWRTLGLLLLTHTINEINFIGLVNSIDYYKRPSMMVRRIFLWAWVSNWRHVRRGDWLREGWVTWGLFGTGAGSWL